MSTPPIELKGLLTYILQNKDVESRTELSTEYILPSNDPKPLIKIINYLLNYLKQMTKDPIDISLKEQSMGCLLSFIISTDYDELPALSDNLVDALKLYNGAMRVVFEKAMYLQILICFCREKIPASVIIEV